MVGIQPERDAKEGESRHHVPRFYGRIKPDKEKFIVKIHAVAEGDPLCADIPGGRVWKRPVPEALLCSGVMTMEAVLPKEKNSTVTAEHGYPFSLDYPLLSSFGNVFTDGTTTFWIFPNLNYQLSTLEGVYGNYLEEGHCETFEE